MGPKPKYDVTEQDDGTFAVVDEAEFGSGLVAKFSDEGEAEDFADEMNIQDERY